MKSLTSLDTITARHATILRRLAAGRSFTTTDLASECGVSRKTLYRDISYLRRHGARIVFDERNKTYYTLPKRRKAYGKKIHRTTHR